MSIIHIKTISYTADHSLNMIPTCVFWWRHIGSLELTSCMVCACVVWADSNAVNDQSSAVTHNKVACSTSHGLALVTPYELLSRLWDPANHIWLCSTEMPLLSRPQDSTRQNQKWHTCWGRSGCLRSLLQNRLTQKWQMFSQCTFLLISYDNWCFI